MTNRMVKVSVLLLLCRKSSIRRITEGETKILEFFIKIVFIPVTFIVSTIDVTIMNKKKDDITKLGLIIFFIFIAGGIIAKYIAYYLF